MVKTRKVYSLKAIVNTLVQKMKIQNIINILTCTHDKIEKLLYLIYNMEDL